MELLVPVSAGELIDKLTILELKRARIADPSRLVNVEREHAALAAVAARLPGSDELARLTAELAAVNARLWQVEDDIRACEAAGDFGPRFVELARAVYTVNDRRAGLKRAINLALGSDLVEEKSYTDYGKG